MSERETPSSPSQQEIHALQAQLRLAVGLHQQGNIGEAARLYEEILRTHNNHFDTTHLLGIAYAQAGKAEEAAALFSRAIEINPKIAEAHKNHGNALHDLRRFDEAITSFNKAIEIAPGFFEAYNNRGISLYELRRLDDALGSYNRAIALKPDYSEAYVNRGNALRLLGRLKEALADYDKAVEFGSDYAETYNNRGIVLNELGRTADAIASYDRAIALKPDYAEACYNRGVALQGSGRFDEAIASFDKAIRLRPSYAEAHNNRGTSSVALERFNEALLDYDRAIAINREFSEAYNNRGAALYGLERFGEALSSYDRAIELNPSYAKAYLNRGNALRDLKRFGEAIESFNKAIALKPDYAEAHWNKSFVDLRIGDFANGWKNYERRWEVWKNMREFSDKIRHFPEPRLTSLDDAAGKRVLVYAEQGLGDTIQFCRYAGLLADRGAKVLFTPQGNLKTLLTSFNRELVFADADDETALVDFQIPLLSLPMLFSTTLDTIPAKIPYLFADPVLVSKWKERLGEGGFKIGICWSGSQAVKLSLGRFFPVKFLESLAHMPDVRLISLHRGEAEAELKALPSGMVVETLGDDFDAGPDAFVDTAAVMKNLDLVITADTSIAHLAGALGVPTWMALKYVPDWRWMVDRPDSPWYPTMRLFRQTADGDWQSVFEEIEAALVQWKTS